MRFLLRLSNLGHLRRQVSDVVPVLRAATAILQDFQT